ncbi:MAG: hypothetical protein V8T00_06280 [Oscillospiraceae bacterium]
MKKTKLPVAWIIFLAAVCALAATVLQSARKAEQEFPDGREKCLAAGHGANFDPYPEGAEVREEYGLLCERR